LTKFTTRRGADDGKERATMKHREEYVERNPKFFDGNIKKITKNNRFFRQVIYTGPHSQLVVMSIPPGEEIGEETHPKTDQLLVIVDGEGEAVLDGQRQPADEHNIVFVTAGTPHNIKNTGGKDLKLFTVYSPPAHAEGTVHKTREEAMQEEEAA
jgi:mannose-6-phosphate isomerase-like protein (cupin superfamily)